MSSQFAKGMVTLMLLARLMRDFFLCEELIQLFSQDIRRIFNRSRSRQKEKNLDITYINCTSSTRVTRSPCNRHVVARKHLGERVAKQHQGRGGVFKQAPHGSLLGVGEANCALT